MRAAGAFALLALTLIGCQRREIRSSVPAVFSEEKCIQCHSFPMRSVEAAHGNDWHSAHFWDPRLVNPGSTMPSYSAKFAEIDLTLSNQTAVTPSGEPVLLFQPNEYLERRFTFNPNHLYPLVLSNVSWSTLPAGLKTFSPDLTVLSASGSLKKIDATPVAWIPRDLKAAALPGERITLLAPDEKLKAVISSLQSSNPDANFEWLDGPARADASGNVRDGKRIYDQHCATCHGIKGDGVGPASMFLDPKPRDFRSGEYKWKTSLRTNPPTDLDLYRTVFHGLWRTGMPGWPALSAGDRWNVVAYLKTFAVDRKTGKNLFKENHSPDVVAVNEPALDEKTRGAWIEKGKALFFTKAKCDDCHGPGPGSADRLPHGDGPLSLGLVDDWGYPIRPADLAGGTLKRGNSPKEVYVTLSTGMMGTPMPSYLDNLTDEERWEVSFYVSSLNQNVPRGEK